MMVTLRGAVSISFRCKLSLTNKIFIRGIFSQFKGKIKDSHFSSSTSIRKFYSVPLYTPWYWSIGATLLVLFPLTIHFFRPSDDEDDEAGDPEDLDLLPSSSMVMAFDPKRSISSCEVSFSVSRFPILGQRIRQLEKKKLDCIDFS